MTEVQTIPVQTIPVPTTPAQTNDHPPTDPDSLQTLPSASRAKGVWLVLGATVGFLAASLLPTEPAYAEAVSSVEKFAILSTPTAVGESDAIFVLDFLTGRLVGVSFNSQANKFTVRYQRNIAGDFNLSGDIDPQFIILPALLNPQSLGGGLPPATGGIYIGEMTSGSINVYGFQFRNATRPVAEIGDIALLDQFQFRQAAEF